MATKPGKRLLWMRPDFRKLPSGKMEACTLDRRRHGWGERGAGAHVFLLGDADLDHLEGLRGEEPEGPPEHRRSGGASGTGDKTASILISHTSSCCWPGPGNSRIRPRGYIKGGRQVGPNSRGSKRLMSCTCIQQEDMQNQKGQGTILRAGQTDGAQRLGERGATPGGGATSWRGRGGDIHFNGSSI